MNNFTKILIINFLLICNIAFSQNACITGKVLDNESKLPLTGDIITLTDNIQSTSANLIGEYIFLNLSEANYKAKIIYVGYKFVTTDVSLQEVILPNR